MYTVTRQIQYPTGNCVVEISSGGIDKSNPDALSPEYDGEMVEYSDPEGAVKAAISICRKWREGGQPSHLGIGATGGYTMPFETCTFKEALRWGKEEGKKLERCPNCNEITGDLYEWWQAGVYDTSGNFSPFYDGDKYCSEQCADKRSIFEEEEEEEKEEKRRRRMLSIKNKVVVARILAHHVTVEEPDIVNDMVWSHADGLRSNRLHDLVRCRCSLIDSISFDLEMEERQLDEDIEELKLLLGGDSDEEGKESKGKLD